MALFHKYDVLQNTRGDSLVGYQVVVRQTGGGSIVPIFADPSGTPIVAVSGLPNVALTDDAGNWSIYVDTGTYDLEFRSPQGAFLKAVRNVPFQNGQDGQKGDPGSQPMVDEFIATDGQTTFQPTFQYAPEAVVVFLNGVQIGASDYTALGNDAPLVFDDGLIAGTKVSFHSFVAGGSGGTSPTPALDELSLSDFPRQAGDDAIAQIGPDTKRMYRMRDAAKTAGKRMFAPAGTYQLWENTQAVNETITGLLGSDDFVLRGAGIDKTIFQGAADVLAVFYGNKQPRGTVQNPQITEPGSQYAINRVELSYFTIVQPGFFLEQATGIGIAAASNVYLHDLKIAGFAGDAIAALMANFGDGSQQGHCTDWTLERIEVDGLGQANGLGGNNRNGVTINDMVRYVERDCFFHDLSRPGDGNQSPEDRTDPNKGPPMPGPGDIEFISGFIFDCRAASTLVERRIVKNTGGAADVLNLAKGNRTNPPFPATGPNAADVAVLAEGHRRVGFDVEYARLGLVSADAPPQAAVGFGAYYGFHKVKFSTRSYEITRFRGMTMEANWYYRSQFAGTLGYVIDDGWYIRDFKSIDEEWEQTGLADGLSVGIYQCDNAAFIRPKARNVNGTWMRLGGQYGRIKGLTIDQLEIQNDGTPGLPVCTASILFVPQPGESLIAGINRQLDLKTIRISIKSLGGAAYPNFATPNGYTASAWRYGEWDANVRVTCTSDDPGAPEGFRTVAANALPAFPRLVRYGVKGLPKPDMPLVGDGTVTPSSDIIVSANNRYEASSANQTIAFTGSTFDVAQPSDPGGEFIVRGIYDRTSMLFVGFRSSGSTDASLANFTGVWFDGGYEGTKQRVAYTNGVQQTLQGTFFHDQYTRIRAYFSSTFGPVLRVYTGASSSGPWTPTGQPIPIPPAARTNLGGYILFGGAGESLNIVSFRSTGTGNGDA